MLNTFDEDLTHKWNFKEYRPDLVVINLGSNDFNGASSLQKANSPKRTNRFCNNCVSIMEIFPLCIYPCSYAGPCIQLL